MFQTTNYIENKIERMRGSLKRAEARRELELFHIDEQRILDEKYEEFSRKEQEELDMRELFWGANYKEDEPNTWSSKKG